MAEPARVLVQPDPTTLREVVRDCLEKCDNDRTSACHMATDLVLNSFQEIARAVIFEAVRRGVDDAIHARFVKQRSAAIIQQAEKSLSPVRSGRAAPTAALSDFPLPSGRTIRDACRQELTAAAEHWIRQGKTMLIRGIWLRDLAKSLKNDTTTVGTALKPRRIEQLWRRAQKQVESLGALGE